MKIQINQEKCFSHWAKMVQLKIDWQFKNIGIVVLVKRSVFGLAFLICTILLKNAGDSRVQDEASRVMRFTGRSSVVADRRTDERLPP